MKLRTSMTINGKVYAKGTDVPWLAIYPFFLLHMAVFGGSGFLMAYAQHRAPLLFLYAHGGFAILIYTIFYLAIFGVDEVKWMFLNAGLGVLGVYTQLGWILALFHKRVGDYPFYVHVIPGLYFVLYTFLLRHAVLDLTASREDDVRRAWVEKLYVLGSVAVYVVSWYFGK